MREKEKQLLDSLLKHGLWGEAGALHGGEGSQLTSFILQALSELQLGLGAGETLSSSAPHKPTCGCLEEQAAHSRLTKKLGHVLTAGESPRI